MVIVPVLPAHPGIFTLDSSGAGQGAILNEDNTFNSAAQPAARGSIIVLFGTGAGQTDPPGEDGKLAEPPFPKPLAPVDVYIYGMKAEILYAGGCSYFRCRLATGEGTSSGRCPVGPSGAGMAGGGWWQSLRRRHGSDQMKQQFGSRGKIYLSGRTRARGLSDQSKVTIAPRPISS